MVGTSSKKGYIVEAMNRKISHWLFKLLQLLFGSFTVPLETRLTFPIWTTSYKQSANSPNVDICISSPSQSIRSNPETFPEPRALLYIRSVVFVSTLPCIDQYLQQGLRPLTGIVVFFKLLGRVEAKGNPYNEMGIFREGNFVNKELEFSMGCFATWRGNGFITMGDVSLKTLSSIRLIIMLA